MSRASATWRPTPAPERHPVDELAARLRASREPRLDLADAIDEWMGEWSAEGLARPCVTIADQIKTLLRAAVEAEARTPGRFDRTPALPPLTRGRTT